jgi:transmembrane sensor
MQRELIDKYFRNECSDEEKQQVMEYFQDNPEEWNKYVNEEDWENFKVNDKLGPGLTERLYSNVSEQTFKKSNNRKIYWLAAAVVTAILALPLMVTDKLGKPAIALQQTEEENLSDTARRFFLEDGSLVVLAPHSSIRYDQPFNREVYLSGKALFEVESNKSRPFIVHADRLVTTVLGTSFTIEAFSESAVIKVKLHKGKVQVAPVNTVHEKWNKKEILHPGDELTYDKGTMLAGITRYTPASRLVKAGPVKKEKNISRPDTYTFDISPLSDVFDQLSVYYQVDIYYYPADIQDKYFSARLNKSDTLETILNDIALLNHLKIEKKDQHYVISKQD